MTANPVTANPVAISPITSVSLGVIAYNEADALPDLLEDILAQDFPHHRIEILLIDSRSSDGTPFIMQDFARRTSGFARIVLLSNPGRYQPQGWNVALDNYRGDSLVRLDAHARIAPDFVRRNVECLNRGENVCGGLRPMILSRPSVWGNTLLLVEQSIFGSSPADYRRSTEASFLTGEARLQTYVDSVFHPAYRRSVLDKVGRFDERLQRTEDNDYSARIRAEGYQIRLDTAIRSSQYLRPNLQSLLQQKAANGFWIGVSQWLSPKSLGHFHRVPAVFVLLLAILLLLGLLASWIPFLLVVGLYLLVAIAASVYAAKDSENFNPTMLTLPFIFLAMHMCYGAATWVGLVRGALMFFVGRGRR